MIITDVVQITINEQIDPVFDSWDMNQDVYVPYMTGIIADINDWYWLLLYCMGNECSVVQYLLANQHFILNNWSFQLSTRTQLTVTQW